MSYWISKNRKLLIGLLAIVLVLGIFEGTLARTFLAADAVSYLDMARVLRAGEWKLAFNTVWGLGYPALLALWLPLFPSSALGEWIGVHCLNLLILSATFFSFYRLVAAAWNCVKDPECVQDDRAQTLLILLAFPVFLSTEIFIDNVSRVGPDMLVSCLVFAVVGTLLRIRVRALMRDALMLGVLLGLGYVVKAVFLPLAVVCLVIEFKLLARRSGGFRQLAGTFAMLATVAIPYAAGMSWSFGHMTLGEAGGLNYAWHVNGLRGDIFWQGGPEGFGRPEHPARQVMTNPAVFVFDGPDAVTFPPWYDPAAYYFGYRHFFNLRNQLHSVTSNSILVIRLLCSQVLLYLLLLGLLLRRRGWREQGGWLKSLHSVWPMLMVSLAGFALYSAVLVYARYLASFVSLLLLALCVTLVGKNAHTLDEDIPPHMRKLIFAAMLIASIAIPLARPRETQLDLLGNLRSRRFFWNDPGWETAQFLMRTGAQPGEKVAVIKSNFLCSWAYLAHLRIVGQVGGENLTPPVDETGIFWHSSPEKQAQILQVLHQSGAQVVVGFEKPANVAAVNWENVPGTDVWVYRRF